MTLKDVQINFRKKKKKKEKADIIGYCGTLIKGELVGGVLCCQERLALPYSLLLCSIVACYYAVFHCHPGPFNRLPAMERLL